SRFLSDDFLTFRFFRSILFISCISVFTLIAYQAIFNPETTGIVQFSSRQIIALIAFSLFTILFDYITIVQTRIFIDASIEQRSPFRAIVLVFSDIIVTINIFILLFSAFLISVIW